ncbi:hypothetical protein CF327_g1404 [Tilletia walkeri]|nr:hypothetical protein CF327_g1404 [Tilletia walkeri]
MPDVALRTQSESQALNREIEGGRRREEDDEEAPVPADALRLTAFQRWYPFHRSHAPRATIINLAELQPEFIPWLESGSFVLPEDPVVSGSTEDQQDADLGSSTNSQGDPSATSNEVTSPIEDDDEEEDELPPPTYSALHKRLCELIEKYDGAVFPKLNWSAPRDAAWIVPGATLKCTSPQDIYLLLKSSDFVATDIAQTRELYLDPSSSSSLSRGSITVDVEASASLGTADRSLPPLHLVIKQHFAFPTSHEFRCFVHRRRLIAISQRDTATAFPHLQPSRTRRKIRRLIRDFWRLKLDLAPPPQRHTSEGTAEGVESPTALLRDYVFDVYLTRDMARVFLVDLAPWGIARTDPLLWNWDELEEKSEHLRARSGQTVEEEEGEDESDDDEDEEDDDDEEDPLPPLRVLSSDPADPSSSTPSSSSQNAAQAHSFSNTPTYAHNMVPADFHALASATAGPAGAGKTLEQLREEWAAAVARASVDDDE